MQLRRTSQKTNSLCLGESPDLATPPRGETPNWVTKHQMGRQLSGGGGGNFATCQITKQWSNISRFLFHTKTCIPCPLCIAVSKFAKLLSTCCKERKGGLYSEAEPINRLSNLVAGLSRLHCILQATSLQRTVYTRTKLATITQVEY